MTSGRQQEYLDEVRKRLIDGRERFGLGPDRFPDQAVDPGASKYDRLQNNIPVAPELETRTGGRGLSQPWREPEIPEEAPTPPPPRRKPDDE